MRFYKRFNTKGIMFKTFMFTTALILLVSLITFGALYAALPSFYFYMKGDNLRVNLNKLVLSLEGEADENVVKSLIMDFCHANNSELVAFDDAGKMLNAYSYPFAMMDADAMFFSETVTTADTVVAKGHRILFTLSHPAQNSDLTIVTGFRGSVTSPSIASTTLSTDVSSPLLSSITLFSTLQPIDEAQNVVVALIPYLLLADVFVALAAAYFYAKTLTRPVLKLSDAASLMQDMTPGVTAGINSGDEFGALGSNLDAMYVQLCANIESLKTERDKVTELERSKTDFMRAASHELKTPLAALTGILEGMIDNVGVYKDHEKYLAESKHQVDRLGTLVNEILYASRLEYLHETARLQETDIALLLKDTLEDYSFAVSEKNIKLSVEIEPQTAFIRLTDKKILKTTLSNLISNAIKYSDGGGAITVKLEAQRQGFTLSIENQCPPIADEALPKLFEPFYVLNYSRNRGKSGTGLGLYIVKRNLEQLGVPYSFAPTEIGMVFKLDLF